VPLPDSSCRSHVFLLNSLSLHTICFFEFYVFELDDKFSCIQKKAERVAVDPLCQIAARMGTEIYSGVLALVQAVPDGSQKITPDWSEQNAR
jgi:hypothetical protein